MKVLIYGDLHINSGKASYTQFVEKTMDYFCGLVHEYAPDVIVNLGDTIDTFGTANVKDVVMARRIFKAICDLTDAPHYVMRGNHDTGDKLGFDTWTDVLDMEDVTIVNHTQDFMLPDGKRYLFVPYTRDFTLDHFRTESKVHGVFAHTDWIGCRLTPKHISTVGFVPAEIARVLGPKVPVFAGHYHTPMQAGPVWFVGSPLYMTFNDEVTDTPRGFTVWDTDPDTISNAPERLTNPHTFICRTFTCDTLPQVKKAFREVEADTSRSRVRVFTKRKLIDKVEEIFADCLWLGVYPQDNEKTEVEFGTKVSLQASPMEIVDQAVTTIPEDLTPALAKIYGQQAFHCEGTK